MKFSLKSASVIFLKASILSFSFFNSADAYLDPGTGSFIIQAIIAFIAAALTFISGLWIKIKEFIVKIFKFLSFKNKDKENKTE